MKLFVMVCLVLWRSPNNHKTYKTANVLFVVSVYHKSDCGGGSVVSSGGSVGVGGGESGGTIFGASVVPCNGSWMLMFDIRW